ncbi:GNAT family N-acetyltransferase [Paenibacillus lycopersici]|uniref:GNAT family N-acetyltransferase n=1 Tax=Paenibacillus lycopersici TaxID=2704462 RepID=A0A6C0G6L1_9BACL|nr:GNAT family N-acetyltransferase [Paenibacillus lycopersici]QHT61345.1 GNAT family N-acetyltransferase [Paenibacillus lycopersici]
MSFDQLEGERISLIPLELEHADSLFHCSQSPQIWENLPTKIHNLNEMQTFIRAAILGREHGEEFPYVVFDKTLNSNGRNDPVFKDFVCVQELEYRMDMVFS